MKTLPLGEVRNRLSELVAEVERTHERVSVTKHGHPAAVIIAAEDLEALEETLDVLSTPGALEQIRAAQADVEAGRFVSGEQLAERYLPK